MGEAGMRAPTVERNTMSPVVIVAGAVVLAVCAMVLLRSGTRTATLTDWRDSAGAPFSQPVGAKVAASPAPQVTPVPIHARVGLQVGHWKSEELPDEFAVLRPEVGASAEGHNEVEINLAVAQRVAALLAARGITVDILPATIPIGYNADAFVAIHCDVNVDPAMGGFKLARFRDSAVADRADTLLGALTAAYGAATGQGQDSHITRAMTGYYAFNAEDFQHAIAPQTPGVIIELGFLTNGFDRALLVGQQDVVAQGLAEGIMRYLSGD
jgi:N-acetylmuramoyl-L-alanine amidase